MQFITFLPQNVSIFLEIFQKVHLTTLLLLETYFVGKWGNFATQNNHCPVHQFSFLFFSFHDEIEEGKCKHHLWV